MSTPTLPPGVTIGRIGGAPVRIGVSWLLLAAVVVALFGPRLANAEGLGATGYAVAAGYAVLLLVSVLVHEGAHAWAALRAGLPVHAVVANLWGGHTSFDGRTLRPGTAAFVAVAGPAANAALGVGAFGAVLLLDAGIPRLLAFALAFSNLLLAGFNLLPGLPLDGGQLVESAVWKATGSRPRGTVVAGWTGLVVTVGLVVWWIVLPLLRGAGLSTSLVWAMLVASYLWSGARGAIARGRALAAMEQITLGDLVEPAAIAWEQASVASVAADITAGRSIVVVDASGRARGLVEAGAGDAVPQSLRHTTELSALAVRQPDGWVVDVPDESTTPILAALSLPNVGVVAVTRGGALIGIVTATRAMAALTRARGRG